MSVIHLRRVLRARSHEALRLPAATGPSAALIKITHLRGPVYVVEDENIFSENSVFYVGPNTCELRVHPELNALTVSGEGWMV